MAGALRVFVSSTTGDLGPCRREVRDLLLKHDILPVIQEQFPPDYRRLNEFLRHEVARCDAVICLVGKVFGAVPAEGPATPRSYTQLEYDTAAQLGQPVFVFLTSESFEPDQKVAESDAICKLQSQHRAALLERHKCEFFTSIHELRDKLSDVVVRLRHLAGQRDMLFLHPPTRPAFFAGRTTELSQLRSALLNASPAVIAVVGMGGQGKTALVREALARLDYFPFAGGLWCTAYRSGFTFDAFLDAALQHFAGSGFDKRQAPDLAARTRRLLIELQRRPLLVVIDGCEAWLAGWQRQGGDSPAVDTLAERQALVPEFNEFLQEVSGLDNGAHLIVTTRALPAALDHSSCAVIPLLEPGQVLGLQGLDEGAAVELLQRQGVKGSPEALRAAAASHGFHPLALEVLAGLLVQYEGGLIDRIPQIKVLEPKRRLFELFDASRQRLPARVRAERVLQVASHFLEDPPLAAVVAILQSREQASAKLPRWFRGGGPAWSTAEVQELVVMLAQWNLLTWDGATKTLRLHPLVKEFFAGCAKDSRELQSSLADYYAAQPVDSRTHSLAEMKSRILAVEHALRASRAEMVQGLLFGPAAGQVAFGEWMATHGHLAAGIDLFRRAAEAVQGLPRAELLSVCGAMLRELGRADRALVELDQAAQLASKARSQPDRLLLAGILLNRANARRDRKLHAEALADYDQAVAQFEQAAPRVGLRLVNALANRGNVYRDLGSLRRAIADYEQALAHVGRLADSPAAPQVAQRARLLINRGVSLSELWELDAAETDLRQALALLAPSEKGSPPEWESLVMIARMTLGSVLGDAQLPADGMAELEAALAGLKRLVDEGRADLELRHGQAEMDRAELLIALGKYRQAIASASLSVETIRRLVPIRGPEAEGFLAHALLVRSEAWQRLNDVAAAEQDRGEALPMLRIAVARGTMDVRPVYVRRLITGAKAALDTGAVPLAEAFLREAAEFAAAETSTGRLTESVAVQIRHRLRICFSGAEVHSVEATSHLARLRALSATEPSS